MMLFAAGEPTGTLIIAAVAAREWHGISLRDVLMFAGAALFCVVVIRFMLAGSSEAPGMGPAAPPTGHQALDQPNADGNQVEVVETRSGSGRDSGGPVPDESQPWTLRGRGDGE